MDNTALEGVSGYVNTALGFPRALFISLHPPCCIYFSTPPRAIFISLHPPRAVFISLHPPRAVFISLHPPRAIFISLHPPRAVFSIHTFGSAFGTACNIWCAILANNNYEHQVCVLLNILQLNQVCASRRP